MEREKYEQFFLHVGVCARECTLHAEKKTRIESQNNVV